MISAQRIVFHIAIWTGVFLFWFLISRNHHPTLLIDALASGVLVAVTAASVSINNLILRPRLATHHTPWRYAAELVAAIMVADIVAVLMIQWIYDGLWGPDPLRFGFLTNVLYEAGFIGVHLVAVWVVGRLGKVVMGRKYSGIQESR